MVDPAWARSRLSYAGWVPNVGSHLSFSLIGSRAGKGIERLSARVTYPDKIARVACALQARTTDDMLLPPRIAEHFKPDLRQDWLLVGETFEIDVPTGIEAVRLKRGSLLERLGIITRKPCNTPEKVTTARDEQGALIGKVSVVPYEEDPEARSQQEAMLADARKSLAAAARNGSGPEAIASIQAAIQMSAPGLITIDFALMRTGETRLWFSAEHPDFNDEEHEQFARQAYFFIKDMCHRHVHHDLLDDQITPLVTFCGDTLETRRKSEEDWRRETLWSLSRVADKRMGGEKLNYLREALGMLAYADAFQKTLLPYVRDPENALAYLPNKSAYGYDFQHIRESTRVRIDHTAARRTVTGQLIAAVFAGAIASLSLASSLIATHNARLATAHENKVAIEIWPWLLEVLGAYPAAVMAISGYLLFAAFALTLSDILFTRPRRRFQMLRGLTLSIARKYELTSDQTFNLLVSAYLIITGVLLTLTVLLIILIGTLPRDLGYSVLSLEFSRVIERLLICWGLA